MPCLNSPFKVGIVIIIFIKFYVLIVMDGIKIMFSKIDFLNNIENVLSNRRH